MIRAEPGPTKPQAGVMTTRPAMAPEIMPSTDGFLPMNHSQPIQASEAVPVAIWVESAVMPAVVLAATAEPALKPNQPTHRSEAPITA